VDFHRSRDRSTPKTTRPALRFEARKWFKDEAVKRAIIAATPADKRNRARRDSYGRRKEEAKANADATEGKDAAHDARARG